MGARSPGRGRSVAVEGVRGWGWGGGGGLGGGGAGGSCEAAGSRGAGKEGGGGVVGGRGGLKKLRKYKYKYTSFHRGAEQLDDGGVAFSRGVLAPAVSTAAPRASSSRTTSKWPFPMAMSRGVAPSLSAVFTAAPRASSSRTASTRPSRIAHHSAVRPSQSFSSSRAPRAISHCSRATLPACAAYITRVRFAPKGSTACTRFPPLSVTMAPCPCGGRVPECHREKHLNSTPSGPEGGQCWLCRAENPPHRRG